MPLPHKPLGKFISFEGAEGSGKSTQIARLAKHLVQLTHRVVTVREPGGTEIGEQVRNIIVHNSGGDEMCAETELLLFAAARAQLVREVIAPALLDGSIVLCDRFMDSSTVYQGIGRNLAADPVSMVNQFAIGNVMPQVTIVLDVPPTISKERIHQRASDVPDRMERENIDFYTAIRQGYLLLAESMPDRIVLIDGTLTEDEIETQIWDVISKTVEQSN
jgi:dTMP kinase